jgi:2-polyprenyl-6-methoxyphenol hydroxylase-like FAD-dependent oxidoreductase
MSGPRTVIGSGATALAAALFAAHGGPVDLHARSRTPRSRSVESVPAAALTLLVELGITPDELDVVGLSSKRIVAWQDGEPQVLDGPACAHIDTAALHHALLRRAANNPAVTFRAQLDTSALHPGWVDATGRRAVSARRHHRPPRTWTAALVTVPSSGPGELRLAAAHDGYAYRLGSAHQTSIGWVGPDRPPLSGAELRARVERRGATWLLDGVDVADDALTYRRAASAAVPEPSGTAVAVGDAALARDALASQGVSIGLSDACLIADPATTRHDMACRRDEAIGRHFRHLAEMGATCRYADAPSWSEYLTWIGDARRVWPSEPTVIPAGPDHVGG